MKEVLHLYKKKNAFVKPNYCSDKFRKKNWNDLQELLKKTCIEIIVINNKLKNYIKCGHTEPMFPNLQQTFCGTQ